VSAAPATTVWMPSASHHRAKSSRLAGIPDVLTIHPFASGLL
jgi:hypothetical protein